MSENKKLYGLLAEYDSASGIYSACEKVRDAGFKKWDACTPFCVHNLDKAMGVKPSYLPWIVLVMGLTGGISGLVTGDDAVRCAAGVESSLKPSSAPWSRRPP